MSKVSLVMPRDDGLGFVCLRVWVRTLWCERRFGVGSVREWLEFEATV